MPHTMEPEEREREKRNAALSSLVAAFLLTALKFVVGISTNSLGILSEAAHSAFDLLAAGMTLFAVKYAAFPPDSGHPYGHGKIENLSALVEALLLLITCGWIVWEAIDRLFFTPAVVEASIWALAVMVFSIIVDFSRSRMLRRIAKKHKSQALEADALHFSTDILSSSVVILGLGALYIASFLPADSVMRPWLERADSIAALGVAMIVVHVSLALAKQAINILLDAGDDQLAAKISVAVTGLAGIHEIRRMRLRQSGPSVFVDMAVVVSAALAFEQIESIRREVENLVQGIDPTIDITLEILPVDPHEMDIVSKVRSLGVTHGLDVHAIDFSDLEATPTQKRHGFLQLHVEMEPAETLLAAHTTVSRFEARLYQEFPDVMIVTHIEPRGKHLDREVLVQGPELLHIQQVIHDIVDAEENVHDAHNVVVRSCGETQSVSLHCRMPPQTSVFMAHKAASRIQMTLYQRLPSLNLVTVHTEPMEGE